MATPHLGLVTMSPSPTTMDSCHPICWHNSPLRWIKRPLQGGTAIPLVNSPLLTAVADQALSAAPSMVDCPVDSPCLSSPVMWKMVWLDARGVQALEVGEVPLEITNSSAARAWTMSQDGETMDWSVPQAPTQLLIRWSCKSRRYCACTSNSWVAILVLGSLSRSLG